MRKPRKKQLSKQDYIKGVLDGDRVLLSQAITLVESTRPQDYQLAQEVLEAVMDRTGQSIRLGITGVPGVGKSTFIEALGKHVTGQGKKLAVIAVDPSSQRSRGSIMGDKTRMEQLSQDSLAYIRPSPTQSSLGGVARRTRETMLLCEAAGYEVIFVETVGVGQSETVVHGMVDFFLLLMLAGAGDELQGIKKGIMEMADAIAINKADGENRHAAKVARAEYESALHLFPPRADGWQAPVLTCSALEQEGIATIWDLISEHHQQQKNQGYLSQKRQEQHLNWMHDTIQQILQDQFYQNTAIQSKLPTVEQAVKIGKTPPLKAALDLLGIYRGNSSE